MFSIGGGRPDTKYSILSIPGFRKVLSILTIKSLRHAVVEHWTVMQSGKQEEQTDWFRFVSVVCVVSISEVYTNAF